MASLEHFVTRVAEANYTVDQLIEAINANPSRVNDYVERHGIEFQALEIYDDIDDFIANYKAENDVSDTGFRGIIAHLTSKKGTGNYGRPSKKASKASEDDVPDKNNPQQFTVDCPDGSTRMVNSEAERDFYNRQVAKYLGMEVEYEYSDLTLLSQLVDAHLENWRISNEINNIDLKLASGGYAPLGEECGKCSFLKLHASKIKDELRLRAKTYAENIQKLQGELSISRKSRNVNVEDPLKIFERTAEELFEHRMKAGWEYNSMVICPDCNNRIIARGTVQSFRAYEAELLPFYLQHFMEGRKVSDSEKQVLEDFLAYQLENLQSEEMYAELLQIAHVRDNDKDFTGMSRKLSTTDDVITLNPAATTITNGRR